MSWVEVIVLVISFLTLLYIGVPVAFSIGIASMISLLVSMPAMPAYTTLAQRMATGLDSFTLLAIPFFILAGQFMNKGGMAKRLIDLAKGLVGMLPGGLAFVNIVASMLFGAVSGSAVAAASAIGGMMHPHMVKAGYPKPFSAAVNITSATTGLLIPPSNILIIFSLASGGVSIAALFMAGYIPGILMGLALMIASAFYAYRKKLPLGERSKLIDILKQFLAALPSLLMLVVVIGGIITGIFTATEASAIAVVYSLVLGFIYKEITFKKLPQIILDSVSTNSVVMILIAASMGMSWVMSYDNIPQVISESLLALSDNKIIILLIINLVLLFVGTFMDMTPAVLIFTPIFLPVVTNMGISPLHFGIIMVMNLCIGLVTPPVGSVLFVGCGVAGVTIKEVLKPLMLLFSAMIIVLILVTYLPQLSLWLPGILGF